MAAGKGAGTGVVWRGISLATSAGAVVGAMLGAIAAFPT